MSFLDDLDDCNEFQHVQSQVEQQAVAKQKKEKLASTMKTITKNIGDKVMELVMKSSAFNMDSLANRAKIVEFCKSPRYREGGWFVILDMYEDTRSFDEFGYQNKNKGKSYIIIFDRKYRTSKGVLKEEPETLYLKTSFP